MTDTKKKIEATVSANPISAEIVCRQYADYTDVRFRAKSEKEADRLLIQFFLQLPEKKREMLRNIDEEDFDVQSFIRKCEKERKMLN